MFTSDIPKVRFSTPFVEYIPVPPRSPPPSSVAHASANICRMHRNLRSNIRSLARSLFSASWMKLAPVSRSSCSRIAATSFAGPTARRTGTTQSSSSRRPHSTSYRGARIAAEIFQLCGALSLFPWHLVRAKGVWARCCSRPVFSEPPVAKHLLLCGCALSPHGIYVVCLSRISVSRLVILAILCPSYTTVMN